MARTSSGTRRRDAPSSLRGPAFAREDFAGHFRSLLRALLQQFDLEWCQHPGNGRGTEPPIE